MSEDTVPLDPARARTRGADAIERARAAQPEWAARDFAERGERLHQLRDAILDRAEALVETLGEVTGSPAVEALLHEVLVAADLAGHYAREASRILAPRDLPLRLYRNRRAYARYLPRGVVLVVGPQVLPFVLPLADVVTALAAGNSAVVALPAECGAIARELRQLTAEPFGDAVQVLEGGPPVVHSAIDADPDFIAFTGSEDAGRAVAVRAAQRLIPSRIHVGGHAPAIVAADADIARTAKALVWGAFHLGGRSCVRVARVCVDERIAAELTARMHEEIASLRVASDPGPAVDVVTRHAEPLELPPGALGAPPGPVLIPDCPLDATIARRPPPLVLPIHPMPESELVAAGATRGLAAYVFTKDKERGRTWAEALPAGLVMVNNVVGAYGTPETPVGPVGMGWGHVHGDEGLREMCHLGQISHERVAVPREPVWFPYGERAYKAGLKAMRLLYRRGSAVKKILDLF
ncbi:MAG: aldehyde dehydrogenase family protein [Deltaproteobacteria bacterium]|nr:aldehyde dehydrogenase family protein [Deltaproteobacteria bacterium]